MAPNTSERELFFKFKTELKSLFGNSQGKCFEHSSNKYGVTEYAVCNSRMSLDGTVRLLVKYVPQYGGFGFQKILENYFAYLGFQSSTEIDPFLVSKMTIETNIGPSFWYNAVLSEQTTEGLLQFEIPENQLEDVLKRIQDFRDVQPGIGRTHNNDDVTFNEKATRVIERFIPVLLRAGSQ